MTVQDKLAAVQAIVRLRAEVEQASKTTQEMIRLYAEAHAPETLDVVVATINTLTCEYNTAIGKLHEHIRTITALYADKMAKLGECMKTCVSGAVNPARVADIAQDQQMSINMLQAAR